MLSLHNCIRIHNEVIQRFTATQAWEYMLIPSVITDNALVCYGYQSREYYDITQSWLRSQSPDFTSNAKP